MDPPFLKTSPYSQMVITIIPKNILGIKTPLSKTGVRFEIMEGSNLLELESFLDNDKAIVRSKGIEGEATIAIYSIKSGVLLNKLLIKIVRGDLTFNEYQEAPELFTSLFLK